MTKEQIKEAAICFADNELKNLDKSAFALIAKADYDNGLTKGFVVGANWRINSVWHSHAIKPDKGKLLIVEDIDGAYDLVYLTKNKPWEELSEKNHYMSWAYIEDLLPNTEE